MNIFNFFKRRPILNDGAVNIYETRHGRMAHFSSDQCIGKSLEIYGEWAQDEIALLRNFILPGSTVIDLGANIGVHTLAFARIVGPSGRVIAIEGEPSTFGVLSYNVVANQMTEIVTAVPAVVGAVEALVPHEFRPPSENVGAMSFYGQVNSRANIGKPTKLSTKLPLITVDGLGLDVCHAIKIDVEGMELDALMGAEKTLREFRPVVYFEHASGHKEELGKIIIFLQGLGYCMWWHVSNPFNRRNIRAEKKNIFGGLVEINVLALPDGMRPPVSLPPLTDPDQPPPRPSLEVGLPGVAVD